MSHPDSSLQPGEILKDEPTETGLNGAALAKRLGIPENHIYQILNGQNQ